MNILNRCLVSLFTCALVTCSITFTSCDRRDITYYMESEINVIADWNNSGLDDEEAAHGATTLFYRAEDGTHHKTLPMNMRDWEDVRLPEGCYHAVIFNRSVTGFSSITFRGDTYETLEACARQVETRTDPETRTITRVIVSTPEDLAVDVSEGFTVTETMLGNYSTEEYLNQKREAMKLVIDSRAAGHTRAEETDPDRYRVNFIPHILTQRIRVKAVVKGVNNIRSAVGLLDGVSEGVRLSTGLPTSGTVTQQFTMDDITYDEGSPFNGTLSGIFNAFGFDSEQSHTLTLKILLVDNKTVVEQTFNVFARNETDEDGTLTFYIEIVTDRLPDVKPEGDPDSGFDATVDEWGDPIDSEVPMN